MLDARDLDRERDALHAIAPDLPRDDWHRVGRAAIAAGLTVDDLDVWSSSASNYAGEQDVRSSFKNVTPEGGTGAASLFYKARAEGWRDQGTHAPRAVPTKAPARPAEPARAPRPGMSAADVWTRCEPATSEHAYIVAKQGLPDGLRLVPESDPLTIAGQRMGGCLVVPMFASSSSEPVSLQFVPPPGAGKKLNLPGASVSGMFVVGTLEPGGTAYLCEGIGQAWACWKATGAAAVVCFGWGRVRAMAANLRQRDASARLVICPDVGKENDAQIIAAEVGAAVAAMPEGRPTNFDANDYAAELGHDALEVLLSRATEPPKPEPAVHPLARYVDIDAEPMSPRYVIPRFIGHGLCIVAGAHGAGKTTALIPLAMVAAGLHAHGDPLAPKHWRHVVYVTEDVEQARRIVAGVVKFGGLGLDANTVRERLHLVEARRLEPSYVSEVATIYREQFARIADGVDIPPLVILDTKSACFSIAEENSNSEASAIVAMLKQAFQNLPVWLVGHLAKANLTRGDVAGLTLRGASAFEADANQVLYLVAEGESRFLVRGKTRFEAAWPELHIQSKKASSVARDEFGDLQQITLRWGIASPPEQTRAGAREQAQEAANKADAAAMRQEVRDAIEAAWQGGFPLNRVGVRAKVNRRGDGVSACIENLLSERWLHEVCIPAKQRANNSRGAFLVNFLTPEHEAVLRGEGLPAMKLLLPESWTKAPIPVSPEVVTQGGHSEDQKEAA